MAFGLSFSEEFFWGDGRSELERSERPTSLAQAILSMPDDEWIGYCKDIFGRYMLGRPSLGDAVEKARQVDTCMSLESPVEVWLDEDGCYTVLVYEEDNA